MPLLETIKNSSKIGRSKEWYETYWAFDFHSTIIKPSYNMNDLKVVYYPYAKEAMQLISLRDDIITIAWTSSFPNEIAEYIKQFEKDGIHFNHIGKNPEISSSLGNFGYYKDKFYFNILFEDKAGFDAETEWKGIYEYLVWCNENNYLPDPKWTTKY